MLNEVRDRVSPTARFGNSDEHRELSRLVREQLDCARQDWEEEFYGRGRTLLPVIIAAVVWLIGAIMTALTLVHLLYWVASRPDHDQVGPPLWLCYAAVSALLMGTGAVCMNLGLSRYCLRFPRLIRPERFYRTLRKG